MPKQASYFLTNALYITFFAFLLISFGLSINSLINPDPHFFQLEMNYTIIAFALLLLFLTCLIFLLKRLGRTEGKSVKKIEKADQQDPETIENRLRKHKINYKDLIIVFLAALIVRLVFLFFYGYYVYPTTDGSYAHLAGIGEYIHRNYELWSSWAIFSVYLRILYQLTSPYYENVQYVNAIVTSLTAVMIYILAYKMLAKRSIALASAAFFAFYPPNILYNAFITAEHFAVLLICIAIWLLTQRQDSLKKHYVLCLIAGLVLGFENSIKGMALVMLVAYTISIILECFINRKPQGEVNAKEASQTSNNEKPFAANMRKILKKPLIRAFTSIIILFTVMNITTLMIERTTERILGIEFAATANRMAGIIYVGLQPSGEGQIHLGNNPRLYNVLLEETGRDFDLARELTFEHLRQDIRENPAQFAMLFPQKFRWAWQDDGMPTHQVWATVSRTEGSRTMSAGIIHPRLEYIAREVLPSVSHVFYMALIAFSAIGAWGLLNRQKERFNNGLFLISLYSFGFFLMLLIIEAQSRYKVMIIPCLCILAAYGTSKVANIRLRKKHQ